MVRMTSLSFGFKKTAEKKVLTDSTLRDVSTKDDDTSLDFIKDVSGNKITGTKSKEEKKELVIPLIQANHWRTKEPSFKPGDEENESSEKIDSKNDTDKDKEENEELSLLEQAQKEILDEAKRDNQKWEDRGEKKLGELPAVMMNQASEGATTDEALDVSRRAEQSSLEDYENVPIEEYGLAMLRGMGWKPGYGVGGYKKEVVQILDPQCRPKGLGLGAQRPTPQEQEPTKEGEEKLTLKKGAFVLIQGGKNRGLYGEVEGLDEDNGRVMMKLGVGGNTVSISENVIKLVTKEEYKMKGKVVNLEKYNEYKEKERIKKEDEVMLVGEKRKKEKKKKQSRSRSRSKSPKKTKSMKTWVRPELRVRCVDKRSSHYKEKLVVVDVVTTDSCDCRTHEGRLLEDIRTDRLETIIPKGDLANVMVVKGEKAGEIGEVINRDKSRYLVTVQLVMSEEVLVLDYDNVCEFVGSVPEYE